MKRFGLMAALLVSLVLGFLAPPVNALEEKAGAFYFGDSGSAADGIIAPTDAVALKIQIAGGSANYSDVKPPVRDVQDLTGDGVLDPLDLTKLNTWIQGNFSDPTGVGKPFSIEILTPTPTVDAGASVELQALVWDNPANGNLLATLRPGWGVIFEVLPTSTCPTARLSGFDPTPIVGGGKNQTILDTTAYCYTDSFANGGVCRLKTFALGCSGGDHIYVRAHIPSDAEAGILGGRFPVALYAPVDIDITVSGPPPVRVCAGIAIDQPDPTLITEYANQTFTATCTYSAAPFTEDCTGAAFWSVTGDATNLLNVVTANQIPGPNGGAGTVKATDFACGDTTDAKSVVVVNDDTLQYTQIRPTSASISELAAQQFQLWEHYSDGFEQLAASANWGLGNNTCDTFSTITVGGLFTAGHQSCGVGCSTQVIELGASNSPLTVTITNDETVLSAVMAPTAPTITEGATVRFSVDRTWSDACVDHPTGIWAVQNDACATTASTINSEGLFTAGQMGCSPGCSAQVTATGADNSPASVTINNNDAKQVVTIVPAVVVLPPSGGSQDFYAWVAYSDGCTTPDDAGGWSMGSGTCIGGDVDDNGVYTVPSQGLNCSDTVNKADAPAAPGSATVTIRPNWCTVNETAAPGITTAVATLYPGSLDPSNTSPDLLDEVQTNDVATGTAVPDSINTNDGMFWANGDQVIWFDSFLSTTDIPSFAVITQVVLRTRQRWNADAEIGDEEWIQWSTNEGGVWHNAGGPTYSETGFVTTAITLTGTFTIADLANLDLRYDNSSEDTIEEIGFDYFYLEVSISVPGNVLIPMVLGPLNTSTDLLDEIQTADAGDGAVPDTTNTNDGMYSLEGPGEVVHLDNWDVSSIPANAAISRVIILTRQAWDNDNDFDENQVIQWSTNEGGDWTSSAAPLRYNEPNAPWVVESWVLPGPFTRAQVAALDIRYTNVSADNYEEMAFDYIWLLVEWTLNSPMASLNEGETKNHLATILWGSTPEPANLIALGGCAVTNNGNGAGTITGDQFPCGGGGVCEVQCVGVDSGDTGGNVNIPVTNDDFIWSTLIAPAAPVLSEGQSQQFSLIQTWSDACQDDLTATAGWDQVNCAGSSITGGGLYTAGWDAIWNGGGPYCDAAVSTATPPADNSPLSFIVADDEGIGTCIGITIDQAYGTTIVETQSKTFSATCAWSIGPDTDCTNDATWSVTGDLTNSGSTVFANHVPKMAGGSGNVTATWNLCTPSFNTKSVVVVNDETIVSTLITPSAPTVLEGGTLQFTLTRTYSDLTSDNLTAGAGWYIQSSSCTSLGSITANGLYTAGQNLGPEGCSQQVSTPAADAPAFVTVNNNDTCTDNITPLSTSVAETALRQFTLTKNCNDGYNLSETAGAGWHVQSSTCSTAGTITTDGNYTAGQMFGPSGCMELVDTTTPPPAAPANVTVTDDDMCVNNITPLSPSLAEGGQQQFTLFTTCLDGFTADRTFGPGWLVQASTCTSAGTITLSGLYTAGQMLGPNGCTEQVTASTYTPAAPANVTVNNNDVCTNDITPMAPSLLEGAQQQFTLTMTCNDGYNLNETNGAGWHVQSSTCSTAGAITVNGMFTAGQKLGPTGCSEQVDTTTPAAAAPANATVNNDETILSSLIYPAPAEVYESGTISFSLHRLWSDYFDEDLTGSADWALSGGNCVNSNVNSSTGLFTAGDYPGSDEPACTTGVISNAYDPANEPAAVTVHDGISGCLLPPVITSVFPLDFADRYRMNAHANQRLTVTMDTAAGCMPTMVTATCGGIPLNCSILLPDPDVVCLPSTNFPGRTSLTCSVTAYNDSGNDTAVGTMQTGLASAPADGGMAGGYIGGLDWDSATNQTVGNFNVVLRPIDDQTHAQIQQKVYAQIIQGGTIIERFLSPTGTTTLTSADLGQAPINELTLGFKCGAANCPKRELGATLANYRAGNYTDYQYMSYYNVDASELNLVMSLMSNSNMGRYKARITGTINEASFTTYIAPQPNIRLRPHLAAPTKMRAAFVFPTQQGTTALNSGLDAILVTPDYDVSISLCVMNTGNPPLDFRWKAALPPTVVLPEFRRTQWNGACTAFATNPSNYKFEAWAYTPNTTALIWSLGAYVNAALINPLGPNDLFSFPIFACALGVRPATIPAGLAAGDTFVRLGTNASWTYDLREAWTTPSGPTGWDPDAGVDRKVLLAMTGRLPLDPARRDATLTSGSFHTPQMTDSALWPDATWDDRFYRKQTMMVTGGDFGLSYGLGVTGLAKAPRIDDTYFTIFAVGYFQSTAPRMGVRDLNYWSTAGRTSQVVSIQQAGINSTWAAPADLPAGFFVERVDGGAVNYVAIAALLRPADSSSQPAGLSLIAPNLNPGSVVSIWPVGAAEKAGNEVIPVNDFLNMPEAVAPGPDKYLYPAPQWSNTPGASTPINRNGELLRVETVSGADAVPYDPAKWNRIFFEFKRPTMMYATNRLVHAWTVSVSETANQTVGLAFPARFSGKSKVRSNTGATSVAGTYIFTDATAHFITQNVKVNDTLWVDSRRYARRNLRFNVSAVNSETSITQNTIAWGAGATTLPGAATNVRYKVLRKTVSGVAARGQCIIDEFYGGGPDGYACKANSFWKAMGPVVGTANIRAWVPRMTPGPAVLSGVTGVIPDLWEGTNTPGTQIEWHFSVHIFNTTTFNQGGLWSAAPYAFDWNNQQWRISEMARQFISSDSGMAMYQ